MKKDHWLLTVFILTFILSVTFSTISSILTIKVNEIGIIKTKDVPATSEEVLLKDDNNIEYYGDGSKYFKISWL